MFISIVVRLRQWNSSCTTAIQREGGKGPPRGDMPVADMMPRRPPKAWLAARNAGPSSEADALDLQGLRVLLPTKTRKELADRVGRRSAGGVHRSLKSSPSSSTFEVIPSTSNLPTRQSQGSVAPPRHSFLPLKVSTFASLHFPS